MALDLVAEERGLAECWLYRCADRSPFAYARGQEFIRCSDHAPWAQLHDDRLVSVRSGDCLAYRVGDTFYDTVSNEPVYYKPSSFSFPLDRPSGETSDVRVADNASRPRGAEQTARDQADVTLAALNGSPASESVLGFAKLFAAMCGSSVRALHVAEPGDANAVTELASREDVALELIDGDPMSEIVRAADRPQVRLVVVGGHEAPTALDAASLTGRLAVGLHQPLLVVPPHAIVPLSLERVLFPLGGNRSTTGPIHALLERLPFGAETELVMLCSYTEEDVPRYADHEPYDMLDRIRYFRDHFAPSGLLGPIEFRFGPPQDVVPEAADALGASLVVVSWSQVLAPGHAAVVKALLASSNRPTLLVPADYGAPSLVPDEHELDLRDDAIPRPRAVVAH